MSVSRCVGIAGRANPPSIQRTGIAADLRGGRGLEIKHFLIRVIRANLRLTFLFETRNSKLETISAERGWKNAHPLYDGFDAWGNAELPLDPK